MVLLDRIFSKITPFEKKIAGIVIFAVIFMFVLAPLFRRNRSLDKEISQKQERLFRYNQIMERQDTINDEYRRSFPASADSTQDKSLISAMKALEATASRYSVKIMDIKQSAQGEGESVVLIELFSEGKKEDYIKFIYELAGSSLLFNIKKCDFKPKENSYLLETRFVISYTPTR
jgi:hypothetical protein